MQLIANVSMLFCELELPDRLPAARDAGFDGVEIQFPQTGDIPALKNAMNASGLPIVLINVPKGPADAVGLAALPGCEPAFREAVADCKHQAQALSVKKVNVLAGRPPEGSDPAECRAVLKRNLQHAAGEMAEIGVRVMVEPVNPYDVTGFYLTGLRPALDLLDELAHPNLALQFDLYHMARTEPDLIAAIRQAGDRIGHVQFADTGGRHEPGTGTVDFRAAIAALRNTGYDGEISAEYRPAAETEDGLGWMTLFREMIA